jgi:CubicO group peptidase (beta-lactamase class C family)
MKKLLLYGLAFLVVGALILGLVFKDRIERVRMVSSLFSGAEQYERFHRVADFFPHTEMPPADAPLQFPDGPDFTLPSAFQSSGGQTVTADFLSQTDTAALFILQNGAVRSEQYWLTGARENQWLSMSVAKSFISALVGIAVDEGHIDSIEDPITKYRPDLAGSAYDDVRIKDILQMSSGAAWNEDYGDPNSDINRFGRIFAVGGSTAEFSATLKRDNPPGTVNHYNSTDTQVLGMLLTTATGRTITDYMTEKLWHPMGAESSAYWLKDSESLEMAFGGLNATARDYAKLGELYRLGGKLNGKQIVPTDWVTASVTPDAPHVMPGDGQSVYDFGYGYQWWIPAGTRGEFSAIGVYNQFIYVDPPSGTVIVKLSANSDYATTSDDTSWREAETIAFFRAIVSKLESDGAE